MSIIETITGKKKKDKFVLVPSEPSDTLFTQQAIEPTSQEKDTMSKPSSYFSVQEHTFLVKGRKDKKGQDVEVKDYALYFEKELMEIPFQPMPTVPERMKHVKLAGMKEMISILEKGYPEETTAILLKESGYKELIKTLKDNKISCLDFLTFLKDEVSKIPQKARVESGLRDLVAILAGLKEGISPEELVEVLIGMTSDEARNKQAVSILEAKLKEHGRDEKGYIKLRTRNAKKEKKGGK